MAVEAVLQDVLSTLPEEASVAARGLFAKHSVDAELLDFLASETGSALLCVWRLRRAADAGTAGNGQEAAEDAALPPGLASVAVQPAAPALDVQSSNSKKFQGRQRISTMDRFNAQHYYARAASSPVTLAPPTSLGTQSAVPLTPPSARARARAPSGGWAWPPCPPHPAVGSAAASRPQGRVEQRAVQPPSACTAGDGGEIAEGWLKSFNVQKGYGFIMAPGSAAREKDVYVRQADLPGCGPGEEVQLQGRRVRFVLDWGDGKPQARQVELLPERRFRGFIKSLGDKYGFLECDEAFSLFKCDVYIGRELVPDKFDESQEVHFCITLSRSGQPQAKDLGFQLQQRVECSAPAVCKACRW